MKTITIDWLRENEACDEQVRLVERLFGETIELTQENWDKAIENGVDVCWLVGVLPFSAWIDYSIYEDKKYREYAPIRQSAYNEYEKIELSAWADFSLYKKLSFDEYDMIRRSAFTEYEKKIKDSVNAEYNKLTKQMLFDILTREEA